MHGWGSDLKSFHPIQNHLAKKFKVYAIDFPGFGQSSEPSENWHTQEYAQLVEEFFRLENIQEPIIFGHSFGGRIGIRLAAKMAVKKLVLIDSAGVKPKRSFEYYFKVYSYKLVKNVLKLIAPTLLQKYQEKSGSTDYKNASSTMKKILINVVNEDLTNLMPQITAPSLLIWGENDQDTPLYQAKTMEKLIPDSGLVILKKAGHFSHLEKLSEFLTIIDHFLKDDV